MLRIVGVQRSSEASQEFLLLQNQGGLRLNLRGVTVLSDCVVESGRLEGACHVFSDEVTIPPGAFVLLRTGAGQPRWTKTRDGAMVYATFMGRTHGVWCGSDRPVHVSAPHHTYSERREFATLRAS
jgi:hypothetical protein